MRTVAFIPARGGSKSIRLKNIRPIAGKPLIYWTVDAALNCPLIDHVFVSTDSEEIRDCLNVYPNEKITVIGRSQESATDYAASEVPLLEFAQRHSFDEVVFIQATSPLLSSKDLEHAISKYREGSFNSLLSVVRQKRFIWSVNQFDGTVIPINYDYTKRPRRQDFEGFLVENGAFYITRRDSLISSQNRLSGKIGHYEMSELSYLEIDEPHDFIAIEQILLKEGNRKEISDERFKNIKMFLTDCDGVLTDGGMYYSETGDEIKKFNTKDAVGLNLLREKGIVTGIITGEDVELVRRRAAKMKVNEIHCGVSNKMELIKQLADKYNITLEQVAYIGDDLNDSDVMGSVGISFSVQDAIEIVKQKADIITESKGGQGAVREACEYIIRRIGN